MDTDDLSSRTERSAVKDLHLGRLANSPYFWFADHSKASYVPATISFRLPISGTIWHHSAMVQRSWTETLDTGRLLSEWRWLCPQALTAIGRNAFGDLFLSDEAGKVHMLDIGSGEFTLIAESVAQFTERAGSPEMQEEWFAESAFIAAQERGLAPGPHQCIGFSVPVVFAESDGLDSAYLIDLYENVGALGDIHRQIAKLPNGAKVSLVVQSPEEGL